MSANNNTRQNINLNNSTAFEEEKEQNLQEQILKDEEIA